MSIIKKALLLGLSLSVSGAQPLLAAEFVPNDGRLLASNCFQCHGIDGSPTAGGFDSLAGESDVQQELLEMSLKFGKTSVDREEEIMLLHAYAIKNSGNGSLSELRKISDYFAAQAAAPGGGGEGGDDDD